MSKQMKKEEELGNVHEVEKAKLIRRRKGSFRVCYPRLSTTSPIQARTVENKPNYQHHILKICYLNTGQLRY